MPGKKTRVAAEVAAVAQPVPIRPGMTVDDLNFTPPPRSRSLLDDLLPGSKAEGERRIAEAIARSKELVIGGLPLGGCFVGTRADYRHAVGVDQFEIGRRTLQAQTTITGAITASILRLRGAPDLVIMQGAEALAALEVAFGLMANIRPGSANPALTPPPPPKDPRPKPSEPRPRSDEPRKPGREPWRKALGPGDVVVDAMVEVDPVGDKGGKGRLPRNNGRWEDEHAAGNCLWFSEDPLVNAITNYEPIRFVNGRPVFDPFVKATIYLPEMVDRGADKRDANRQLARVNNRFNPDGTPDEIWAEAFGADCTWHHHPDKVRMQLVPSDLHDNVPHIGGHSATHSGK